MVKKHYKLWLGAALFAVVLLCSACSGGGSGSGSADVKTTAEIPVILNQAEYVLYQNIFYNDYGPQYDNTPVTKNGVFAVIQDGFSNVTRYYVWGYLDNTMCCDWQWEIVPKDTKNLPAPGSLVTVTGTFAKDQDKALDGYWIKDVEVSTVTAYTGQTAELNMLAMSDTLERVQMLNIMYRPDSFEGKTFLAYGRIAGVSTLQDPYYDGSWEIPFSSAEDTASLAIGTSVHITGKVASGTLGESKITVMQ
ncbi:MAG: hypothetical protein IKH57_01695 [Clostridia bacterium]|nr:hypothetical protein [Clostridia bacterium]